MAISDAEYKTWLANPEEDRLMLAEVKAYSEASEVTRYLGSRFYHTGAADSPANTTYLGRLVGSPAFTVAMSEAFGGRSFISIGSIEIDNSDGELDSWITDAWDGRDATIKIGDPAWEISDFRTILTGLVDRLAIQDDLTLELTLRDRQRQLDVPIQTTLIGSGPNEDSPIPLCYGEVFNITPVLINDTTHEYQVHEGQIEDVVAVYEDGVATSLTVTEDLSNGKFTLSAAPSGALTCDIKGHDPSGVYKTKPGDVLREIVCRVLTDPGDLDTTAFTTMNTDADYTIGIYISARENLLDVVDQILPAAWYYGFDRAGLFTLAVLKDPSAGSSVLTIDDLETHGDLGITKADVPSWRTRVGYKKCWSTNTSPASTATESHSAWLLNEFSLIEKSEDASIKTTHLLAQDPDLYPSMIAGSANATTEAARLQTLFGTQRYTYTVSAYVAPYQVEIGDVVTITDDRFDLGAGVDCRVTGLTEFFIDNRIELELWQ